MRLEIYTISTPKERLRATLVLGLMAAIIALRLFEPSASTFGWVPTTFCVLLLYWDLYAGATVYGMFGDFSDGWSRAPTAAVAPASGIDGDSCRHVYDGRGFSEMRRGWDLNPRSPVRHLVWVVLAAMGANHKDSRAELLSPDRFQAIFLTLTPYQVA
jgi:hypothetical protein